MRVLKEHIVRPASYKRQGFLAAVAYEGNRVHYRVAEEFVSTKSLVDRSWGTEERALYGSLLRSGVWSNVARTRIHEQGTEVFRFYVEALPYQKNVRKPGAWLIMFIGERSPLAIEPPWRRLQEAEAAPVEPTASLCSAATQHDEPALHEPHRKANSLWQDVVKCMGDRIDVSSLRVWLECTMDVGLETYALVVAVPNGLRRGIHRDQVQVHPRRGAAFPPFPY